MPEFQFFNTSLNGVILISPLMLEDSRGMLFKTFEKQIFEAHGITIRPWEELRSCSKKGVLRGLHFQRRHSQDKLLQVLHGAVYDVAVDLRKGSATFGKWEGFHLSAQAHNMLYIPKGFAHGFLALEEDSLFSYLCGDCYDPEADGGIRWDDPQLDVKWPLEQVGRPILSEKDLALPSLQEFLEKYGPFADAEAL